MKKALLISCHFPPDYSAATHRVRLLAPHLKEFGWEPTVLTVEPKFYESEIDPSLMGLVPEDLEIIRTSAIPAPVSRKFGIGDLGLRSLPSMYGDANRLLSERDFDVLFVTIFPMYTALVGALLARKHNIPFVLDYIDPWVGSWGSSVGSGPNGAVRIKDRLTNELGKVLEPFVVRRTSALTAVSSATYEQIFERNPDEQRKRVEEIPYGGEQADFEHLLRHPRENPYFEPDDGNVHICYVGTLLPLGFETLRAFLKAVRKLKGNDAELFSRLRVHFFGTSNQTDADSPARVLAEARRIGVDSVISEVPARIEYLDALTVQTQASAILLMGSSERHYTASKIYPALLSRRPVLAIYHEESTVVDNLRAASAEPTVRVCTYGEKSRAEDKVDEIYLGLRSLVREPKYREADVNLDSVQQFSARSLSERLARVFEDVSTPAGS
jgi:hypothetical protein